MTVCSRCGVELDNDMEICPLCGVSASGKGRPENVLSLSNATRDRHVIKRHLLQQILWQITTVLLFFCMVSTLLIDFSVTGSITWSIYPVTVCLIVFSYASIMVFWHTRIGYQALAGWLIAAVILMVVNRLIYADWPLKLALPLLCAGNIVGLLLLFLLKSLGLKGLSIITVTLVLISTLCLAIEGIISFYFENAINLRWSVIVAACLLPVAAAVLFIYFRIRNNSDLQKIFHT